MAELNRAHVTDEQWQAFIKDIAEVQDKHKLILVPTFKWNAVQGINHEWGAVRQEPKDEKTNTSSDDNSGDKVPKKAGD